MLGRREKRYWGLQQCGKPVRVNTLERISFFVDSEPWRCSIPASKRDRNNWGFQHQLILGKSVKLVQWVA